LEKWYNSNEYEALKTRHYTKAYHQNIINTAIYDGILNSGLITYLNEQTQSKLNTYYFYAALHNKRMFDMAKIYNNRASAPDFKFEDIQKLTSSLAWDLNEIELTKYGNEMKKLIPELRGLLDEEIENSRSWFSID
jgi:hypothetical protein